MRMQSWRGLYSDLDSLIAVVSKSDLTNTILLRVEELARQQNIYLEFESAYAFIDSVRRLFEVDRQLDAMWGQIGIYLLQTQRYACIKQEYELEDGIDKLTGFLAEQKICPFCGSALEKGMVA